VAHVCQAHHANSRQADHPDYVVGQLVYLSTEHLELPLHWARKLALKFIRPFKISEVHNKASVVCLDLPPELTCRGIHSKFHVLHVRTYCANDNGLFLNRAPINFYDFGIRDDLNTEEAVDEISAHYWEGSDVLFLLKRTG
jgi:hypothetical protein